MPPITTRSEETISPSTHQLTNSPRQAHPINTRWSWTSRTQLTSQLVVMEQLRRST